MRLRSARELLGQTQGQLAARLGVSVRAYSRYENEERTLPEEALKALAALGISLTWLITGVGEVFIDPLQSGGASGRAETQLRDSATGGTFEHLRKPASRPEERGPMSSVEFQAATRTFLQIVSELGWQPPQLTGMAVRDAMLLDGLSGDMAKFILNAVRQDLGDTEK